MDSMSNLLQTNISNDDIKLFIKNELDTPSNWEIESISLRGYDDSGYTYSMPGWLLYVMQPEQSSIIEAQNKINKIINKNN